MIEKIDFTRLSKQRREIQKILNNTALILPGSQYEALVGVESLLNKLADHAVKIGVTTEEKPYPITLFEGATVDLDRPVTVADGFIWQGDAKIALAQSASLKKVIYHPSGIISGYLTETGRTCVIPIGFTNVGWKAMFGRKWVTIKKSQYLDITTDGYFGSAIT